MILISAASFADVNWINWSLCFLLVGFRWFGLFWNDECQDYHNNRNANNCVICPSAGLKRWVCRASNDVPLGSSYLCFLPCAHIHRDWLVSLCNQSNRKNNNKYIYQNPCWKGNNILCKLSEDVKFKSLSFFLLWFFYRDPLRVLGFRLPSWTQHHSAGSS